MVKKKDATSVLQEAATSALYCFKRAYNAIGGLSRRFNRWKWWFKGMEKVDVGWCKWVKVEKYPSQTQSLFKARFALGGMLLVILGKWSHET